MDKNNWPKTVFLSTHLESYCTKFLPFIDVSAEIRIIQAYKVLLSGEHQKWSPLPSLKNEVCELVHNEKRAELTLLRLSCHFGFTCGFKKTNGRGTNEYG